MSDAHEEASEGRAEPSSEAFTAEEIRNLKRVTALANVTLKTHTITQARSLLPNLVRGTAGGGPPVVIGRQGHEEAVLLAFEEFAALRRNLSRLVRRLEAPPVANVDMRQSLSEWIARRLLPDAQPHLIAPQTKDLARLSLEDLAVLMPIEHMPLTGELRARVGAIQGGTFLKRLEQRHAIAKTISEAAREGIYDTLEQKSGDGDTWLVSQSRERPDE